MGCVKTKNNIFPSLLDCPALLPLQYRHQRKRMGKEPGQKESDDGANHSGHAEQHGNRLFQSLLGNVG